MSDVPFGHLMSNNTLIFQMIRLSMKEESFSEALGDDLLLLLFLTVFTNYLFLAPRDLTLGLGFCLRMLMGWVLHKLSLSSLSKLIRMIMLTCNILQILNSHKGIKFIH